MLGVIVINYSFEIEHKVTQGVVNKFDVDIV